MLPAEGSDSPLLEFRVIWKMISEPYKLDNFLSFAVKLLGKLNEDEDEDGS